MKISTLSKVFLAVAFMSCSYVATANQHESESKVQKVNKVHSSQQKPTKKSRVISILKSKAGKMHCHGNVARTNAKCHSPEELRYKLLLRGL